MNIAFTENTHPGTLPPSDQLGFGSVFTDHMFLMDYSAGKGWHDARIVPYGPISLSPAASVLHYGTEVFEGLKAYRRPDGGVQLFRPWENVARLNRSCERLGLPQLDPDDALQAIKEIVRVDQRWVPNDPGTSLYIRPFLYSTDPTLALHGVHEASFVIILSPSGSYFSDGLKPVPIMVETEDVRAVRGGTGEAKCGGNYGAANRAGERAEAKGYSQVLWLDGVERKYVEEGGGMNVMFKINGTVVTPALTGSILRGVTRKSAIELLKSWGVPVEERLLSVDELFEAAKQLQVPVELVKYVHENGKLPVVNFAAGGVATPADAALMMQLGAEGVFVGSGIFKSGDPAKRARAIVQATTNYTDAALIARLSENLGPAMVGINEEEIKVLMAQRGI